MASKQGRERVRRVLATAVPFGRMNETKVPTAILAALLVQFAGTTLAVAQAAPPATPPASPAKAPQEDTKIRVDENQIVDLHVNDEDLANVLEMLSIQSQKNIVASKNVSARVTANLYGVTFFEAMDAILNVNGYGYIEQGNFIFVYTLEELKTIEQATKIRVSKVIPLNYLNAIDAAEFVKPLLSEGGQIKTNGKSANFPSIAEVPIGGDEYANESLLVIYDYQEHVDEIEVLVKQIDTRPAQVLVEATILQTSLNEANALGVDFALLANLDFGEFVGIGGPTQAVNTLIGGRSAPATPTPFPADGGGSALASTVGNTAAAGGLKIGVVSNDVAVFLRVLDEVTDTTIISNPKVLALNRQASRVLVGRKVGYLSTTSTDTSTTQTVEFLDTGTQLAFRPFVTNDGQIRMELKPQVSEAVIRQINDATGAAVTIPDEITNELTTNVIVRDGQTIVLGGLFRESTQSTRRQIPLLGDIPLIGMAFRGNEDETERNEIIFLVTPTIMNDETLAAQGERSKDYVDRIHTGSREGTLFWSRDKMTNMLNVDAERLAREGNTKKALWKVQRSLSLNHNQPEVVGLRQKITGEKDLWPSRSFIDRIIDGETDSVIKKRGDAGSGQTQINAWSFESPTRQATPVISTSIPVTTTTDRPETPVQNTGQPTKRVGNGVPWTSNDTSDAEFSTLQQNYNPSNPHNITGNVTAWNDEIVVPNTVDVSRGWMGSHGLMGNMWLFFRSANANITNQTFSSVKEGEVLDTK